MRTILTFLLLCAGLVAYAQKGTVFATPSVPQKGTLVTFTLNANPLPAGAVTWDFGDGQNLSGGLVTSHTYAQAGYFPVRATFLPIGANSPFTALLQIHVISPTGPAAPFTISALRLRWEDGRTDLTVDKGYGPLAAFADLKYEGTGLLQVQWLLDGVPIGTFAQQLAFADKVELDSRRVLPLPTTEPGEHLVSLRFLSPLVTFQVPQIRYFVRSESQEVPRVDTVLPSLLTPGQEMELWLTGHGLVKGVRLFFGKGVALVAPLKFHQPGRAVARVFISPTAREGVREVHVSSPAGRSSGPATVQVLPPPPPEPSKENP